MVYANFVLHYTGNKIYITKAQNSSRLIHLKVGQTLQTPHLLINLNVTSPFPIIICGVTLGDYVNILFPNKHPWFYHPLRIPAKIITALVNANW